MSKELVMNLYEQMVNAKDASEAKIIKNMYNNQDYKNDMVTEYFDKKYSELKIIELSKTLNNNNVGLSTDCSIDVVKMENRLFPVMTLIDSNNKSLQVALSLNVLSKLNKQINTSKAKLSLLQYIGVNS